MNIDFKRKSTISTTIFSNYVIQSRMNGLIARIQQIWLSIKDQNYINEQSHEGYESYKVMKNINEQSTKYCSIS